MKIVIVEWNNFGYLCRSIGWLESDDRDKVRISSCIDEKGQLGNLMTIHRENVYNMKEVPHDQLDRQQWGTKISWEQPSPDQDELESVRGYGQGSGDPEEWMEGIS